MTDKQYSILDEILVEQYTRGYEEADSNQRENAIYAYERGLNDAWECARKIGKVNWLTLKQIGFEIKDKEKNPSWDVVMEYSASEVITKIKEYEEKQKQTDDEIKVGDEVKHDGEQIGVVTQVDKYGYQIMDNHGEGGRWITDDIKKTGHHFSQIAEVLKQMNEVKE